MEEIWPPERDAPEKREELRSHATTDHPLHGRPRPRWRPLLYLLAFVVTLVLIYLLGVYVLVPAD